MRKKIEVVAAVIIHNHKILCTQRSNKMHLAHQWEFPGGKVEEGESLTEALVREIHEELNCTVKVGRQIARTPYDYETSSIILHTFYCTLTTDAPQLLEHEAMRWMPVELLMSLSWAPADIPTVKLLMNNNK